MGRCEYCFSSNSTARKKRKRQEQEQEQEHEQTSGHTSGHDRGHTSARWISYNDAIESTQPLLLSTLEQHTLDNTPFIASLLHVVLHQIRIHIQIRIRQLLSH